MLFLNNRADLFKCVVVFLNLSAYIFLLKIHLKPINLLEFNILLLAWAVIIRK